MCDKRYKKLSILIPAYNEKNTICEIIKRVQEVKIPLEKEIIIVDDGSTDGTREIINKTILSRYDNIKYYEHSRNIGKGGAIRTALKHHTGDIVVVQDSDLEYDPNDYAALIKPLMYGESKVVFGSRYLYEKLYGRLRSARPLFRFGGFFITYVFNLIYQSKLTDEPTCYKLFDSDVINGIKLDCKRFEFCPEVTGKIIRLGYKIKEIPIKYEPRSFEEGKKIGIKDGIEAVYVMLKYRFKRKKSFINDAKSSLDEIVPEYDSCNPFVRRLFMDRLKYAEKFSRITSNQKVLDIGTGNGILLKRLSLRHKDTKFVGLDTNPQIKELSIFNTEFVLGDVRRQTFISSIFDIIYCLDVLEHVKELNQAISEIKRVLKNGGQLIVSVPQETVLYKTGRFLIKGTFSQEKGPCASPHFWNAKQLIKHLNNNFKLQKQKVLYKPFPFFQVLSYENIKR